MCKCGNNLVPWGDGGGTPVALGTVLETSEQTKFT